jgi:putative two-component system response regulator
MNRRGELSRKDRGRTVNTSDEHCGEHYSERSAGCEHSALLAMRVLIVDDNQANTELLEQLLEQAGYTNLLSTGRPQTVAALCDAWKPDLMLLDLHMPELSGFEVLSSISNLIAPPESLPVLVVTADTTTPARHQALNAGARDYITKPVDGVDLLLRVRTQLLTRHLQRRCQNRNEQLDEAVRLRTLELEQARTESLAILASVTEYHDGETHDHTQRVGALAALIARRLGLPETVVATIRAAAPLHDIGKIAIAREILLKPGPLSADERHVMMRHVEIGARMLAPARSPVLRLAAEIARTHHERWDGTGYLAGLAGEQIPVCGRITAVADMFDALTHERPYKRAWDRGRALAEISAHSGRQFDPRVVAALFAIDLGTLAAIDLGTLAGDDRDAAETQAA